LIALFAKVVLKKSIGTSKYYSTAMMLGFVIYAGLISAIHKPGQAEASSSVPLPATGLDAPFIAPPKENMESFVQQLTDATKKLPPEDSARVANSVRFLFFIATDDVKQKEPDKFAKWNELDIIAHSLTKAYNYAVDQGNAMTLHKYILLADAIKNERPDLYQRFVASDK
jgi:hypothetical protein